MVCVCVCSLNYLGVLEGSLLRLLLESVLMKAITSRLQRFDSFGGKWYFLFRECQGIKLPQGVDFSPFWVEGGVVPNYGVL